MPLYKCITYIPSLDDTPPDFLYIGENSLPPALVPNSSTPENVTGYVAVGIAMPTAVGNFEVLANHAESARLIVNPLAKIPFDFVGGEDLYSAEMSNILYNNALWDQIKTLNQT